ncbi:hypothetical protein NDO75_18075 [Natrinema sp. 1APR25-10V2]|nr:hypothetical protein [Natrinema sp. 1APR25-10V2]
MLREFADKTENAPTVTDVKDADEMPTPGTYRRRFGSWNDALRAAGIEPCTNPSKEELRTTLQDFADSLGETPTAADARDADEVPSPVTYRRQFESWNNALKAAGLPPNLSQAARNLSDDDLLELLYGFGETVGHPPTSNEVRDADQMPSPQTYHNRFGRWHTAIQKAGFHSSAAEEAPTWESTSDDRTRGEQTDTEEPVVQVVSHSEKYTAQHLPTGTTVNAKSEIEALRALADALDNE